MPFFSLDRKVVRVLAAAIVLAVSVTMMMCFCGTELLTMTTISGTLAGFACGGVIAIGAIVRAVFRRQDERIAEMCTLSHIFRHDTASPLSVIRMIAENLLSGLSDTSACATSLFAAEKRIATMNDLHAKLSDNYSRIDGAPLEVVNINKLVAEVVQEFAEEAKENGVLLKTALPSESLTIKAHEVKLRAILSNLIGNAIKYTLAGGSVQVAAEGGESLRLIVSDTGIGIKEDEYEKIFLPGYRSARAMDRPGRGYGLALVKSLVSFYNGSCLPSPNGKQGTTFTITIPLTQSTIKL